MLSTPIFDFPVDQKHRFANFSGNVYALDQSAITFLVPIEMQQSQNKAPPITSHFLTQGWRGCSLLTMFFAKISHILINISAVAAYFSFGFSQKTNVQRVLLDCAKKFEIGRD